MEPLRLDIPPLLKVEPRQFGSAMPQGRMLVERRVLLMYEPGCGSEGLQHKARFVPVWVDDHGTCFEKFPGPSYHHVFNDDGSIDWRGDPRYGSPFHSYIGKHGLRYAIRCPSTLSEDEKRRLVVDIPSGAWRDVAATMLEGKVDKPSSRRKSKADEAMS